MLRAEEILFCGIGKTAATWYRCALPAIHIGADWVGVLGRPPALHVVTGTLPLGPREPAWEDYKVVIIQRPRGPEWLQVINRLEDQGIKVLYEIDVDVESGSKPKPHFSGQLESNLQDQADCLRACKGIICSTHYIARRCAAYNRNVYVAKNGLDVRRYNLTRPERSTITFGWAGAGRNVAAVIGWVGELVSVMRRYDNTRFVAIGQPAVAQLVNHMLGGQRAIGLPLVELASYPAALSLLDIALAPSSGSPRDRARSDLRFLETGALGIPIIADPWIHPEIEHRVTGFNAATAAEMVEAAEILVVDGSLRRRVGEAAREYVRGHRAMEIVARQWHDSAAAVVGDGKGSRCATGA